MFVHDQTTDPQLTELQSVLGPAIQSLIPENKLLVEKTAAAPSAIFAWPEARRFPVNTPESTTLSWLYAVKQAQHVPKNVLSKIAHHMSAYGNDPRKYAELMHQRLGAIEQEKTASVKVAYALPSLQSLRIDSPEAVEASAARLGEQFTRLTEKQASVAAENIINKAAEFAMPVDSVPETVYRLAGMQQCDAGVLVDKLAARAETCASLGSEEGHQNFYKLAKVVEKNFPPTGVLTNRKEMLKLANNIARMDRLYGLEDLYDQTISRPRLAVFNYEKFASDGTQLGNTHFPWRVLAQVPAETYEDILGDDFSEEIAPGGEVNMEMLKAIIPTLPLPMKQALETQLKSYV